MFTVFGIALAVLMGLFLGSVLPLYIALPISIVFGGFCGLIGSKMDD